MSHDTDTDSDASLLSDVEPGWSLVDRKGEVESSDDSADYVQISSNDALVTFHHRERTASEHAATDVASEGSHSLEPTSVQTMGTEGLNSFGHAAVKEEIDELQQELFSPQSSTEHIGVINPVALGSGYCVDSVSWPGTVEQLLPDVIHPVSPEVAEPILAQIVEQVLFETSVPVSPELFSKVVIELILPEEVEHLSSDNVQVISPEIIEPVSVEVIEPVLAEVIESVSPEVVEPVLVEIVEPVLAEKVEPVSSEAGDPTFRKEFEPISPEAIYSDSSISIEPVLPVLVEVDADLSDGQESIVSADWPDSAGSTAGDWPDNAGSAASDGHSSGDDFITVESHEDLYHLSGQRNDFPLYDLRGVGQHFEQSDSLQLVDPTAVPENIPEQTCTAQLELPEDLSSSIVELVTPLGYSVGVDPRGDEPLFYEQGIAGLCLNEPRIAQPLEQQEYTNQQDNHQNCDPHEHDLILDELCIRQSVNLASDGGNKCLIINQSSAAQPADQPFEGLAICLQGAVYQTGDDGEIRDQQSVGLFLDRSGDPSPSQVEQRQDHRVVGFDVEIEDDREEMDGSFSYDSLSAQLNVDKQYERDASKSPISDDYEDLMTDSSDRDPIAPVEGHRVSDQRPNTSVPPDLALRSIVVVLVVCGIGLGYFIGSSTKHRIQSGETTGLVGNHTENMEKETGSHLANETITQGQMIIAVTRAWKNKYEELVEERADLELKLKTVQGNSMSKECKTDIQESKVTWELSKQLADLESKHAADAATNLAAFERGDNETAARIRDLAAKVAKLEGELKVMGNTRAYDSNVGQELLYVYHSCRAEVKEARDEMAVINGQLKLSGEELVTRDANIKQLEDRIDLLTGQNEGLKREERHLIGRNEELKMEQLHLFGRNEELKREERLLIGKNEELKSDERSRSSEDRIVSDDEEAKKHLDMDRLKNELNELKTEHADIKAQLLSQRYMEHPGNGVNGGASQTEELLRRNASELAVENGRLKRLVEELVNNSTVLRESPQDNSAESTVVDGEMDGETEKSSEEHKHVHSPPLTSDFINSLVNLKTNWSQFCSELTKRYNSEMYETMLLADLVRACNRTTGNTTQNEATLKGFVNKTFTKLGQTIQSTIRSVRNITDKVFVGRHKFVRNIGEKVKDSIRKMNSKVQSKLKRLNEKFDDWSGRFINWSVGNRWGRSKKKRETDHSGDTVTRKNKEKDSRKHPDSKENRWKPEKPDEFLHEEFFAGDASDWHAHEPALLSTIENILGVNEFTFPSKLGSYVADVYGAFDFYSVHFKRAPKRLYAWLNCQRRWWKNQAELDGRFDGDLYRVCKKQLLRWQQGVKSELRDIPVQSVSTESDDPLESVESPVEKDASYIREESAQRKREAFSASKNNGNVDESSGDHDVLRDSSTPTSTADEAVSQDDDRKDRVQNDKDGAKTSESNLPHEDNYSTGSDDAKWYFDRMVVREDWRHDPGWYLRAMSRNDWRVDSGWYLKSMKRGNSRRGGGEGNWWRSMKSGGSRPDGDCRKTGGKRATRNGC